MQQGCCLLAGLDVGSATGAGGLATKDVTAGDKLDPKRTVAFVVRGVGGFAQRIEAVLGRTRGCGGESRQLEDHPGAFIQFRHAEGQGRPFGGDLELTACPYVGCTADGEFLAVEAENGYGLRRISDATSPCTNNRAAAATSASCGSATGRTATTCSSTRGSRLCAGGARPSATSSRSSGSSTRATCRSCAASASPTRSSATTATTATTTRSAGANIHDPDITLAHRSVPGGLHFAAIDEWDSAVDDDKGIRYTAD